jgi:hypothetical protein
MIWKPHPGPQEVALQRQEFEVLYGGARGGGKTDAGIVKPTDHFDKPRYRALIIRKNAKDLTDWVDRAVRMYSGFKVHAGYQPPIFKFPSGAKLLTGHLNDAGSYMQYVGQEFQYIGIEELNQIVAEKMYIQLISSCRSSIPGIKPQVFNTTNPGGPGHAWIQERWQIPDDDGKLLKYPYINAKGEKQFGYKTPVVYDKTSGRTRIYLKATVDDNPSLFDNDPGYVMFLDSIKDIDPDLYEAWRHGSWNVFAGKYFKLWRRQTHVTRPFIPRKDLMIIGGLDWGRTNPFSFHLAIVYPVTYEDPKTLITYKFYRAITFFEKYGTDKTPPVWSQEIQEEMSRYGLQVKDISWVQADNRIFVKGDDGSISIADQFIADNEDWRGVLQPGSKDRVGGWENMQNWMSIAPDGIPYWLQTSNCIKLAEEIPTGIRDDNNVEDLFSITDHALDEQRYMLKALKWIDAKAGGFTYQGGNRQKPGIKTPLMDVDLDLFATAK